MWQLFDNGKTINQKGSENGTIIKDEEIRDSCRITLEKNGVTAPYSITCGIYGLMCHTSYSKSEAEARTNYEKMKKELETFIQSSKDEYEWCESFTSKW